MELQNGDLLRSVIDSSMDMIQVFKAVRNAQHEIIDFVWILNNKAAEAVYGDVVGKSLLTLHPGVVEEGIFASFVEVVETGIPHKYEQHYVHEQFNGWFHQSVVKLHDGITTTTSNITERKIAEAEKQSNERKLQNIIDAPNIGIALYRAVRNDKNEIVDFIHESFNRASIEMLGEDFTGRLFSEHGENAAPQMHLFREVVESGIGNSYLRDTSFRGRDVCFSISNRPLDGERLVHTWEDITVRRNAQAEIFRLNNESVRRATDKYYSLFNSIDEGFAILELVRDENDEIVDLVVRETNQAFETHTGLKDVCGKRISALFPAKFGEILDMVFRVAETGIPYHEENYQPDVDRWYEVVHLRIGQEGSQFISAIFKDITERKRHEKRQGYLLKLSDGLRTLSEPHQFKTVAASLLGRELQAALVFYAELNVKDATVHIEGRFAEDPSLSVDGNHRLTLFSEIISACTEGKPLQVSDLKESSLFSPELLKFLHAVNICSVCICPVLRGETLVAALVVAHHAIHDWKNHETALILKTAERLQKATEKAREEQKLATELNIRQRLQQISNSYAEGDHSDALFEAIILSALEVMQADAATLQLLDEEAGKLLLLTSRGLDHRSVEIWQCVKASSSGLADQVLATNSRLIIPDMQASPGLSGGTDLKACRLSGIRAIQITPLFSRTGRRLGMISTYWKRVHSPAKQDLALIDVLARQAADLIQHRRSDEALRIKENRMHWQKEAFRLAVNEAPLHESLQMLSRMVEKETNGAARTAFYTANTEGTALFTIRGAGSMSDEYADVIDGFVIGEESLACGLAVPQEGR